MVLTRRVQLSTLVLVTIGMFDLVTTLMLMHTGVHEVNPLFANLASYGSLAFACGKLFLLAGPVLLLEYVRTKNPLSAEQGTWLAAGLYAFFYVSHLVT